MIKFNVETNDKNTGGGIFNADIVIHGNKSLTGVGTESSNYHYYKIMTYLQIYVVIMTM